MVVTFHLSDGTANGLFTCPSKYSLVSDKRTSAILNTADVLILSNVPVYIGPYNRVAYDACLRILHQFNVLLEISVALVPCILAAMPSNNL